MVTALLKSPQRRGCDFFSNKLIFMLFTQQKNAAPVTTNQGREECSCCHFNDLNCNLKSKYVVMNDVFHLEELIDDHHHHHQCDQLYEGRRVGRSCSGAFRVTMSRCG